MRLCFCFTQRDRRLSLTCWLSGLLPLRLPVRKCGSRRCPSPCSPSRWRTACSDTGPEGSGNSGRSAGRGRWRGWGRRRRPPFAQVWGRRRTLRRKRRRRKSPIQKQRRCCCRGRRPCWDGEWLVGLDDPLLLSNKRPSTGKHCRVGEERPAEKTNRNWT